MPIESLIEAVLFAAGEPLKKKRLATLLEMEADDLKSALKALHAGLQGRGLALVETEDEVELRTAPAAATVVKKYRESELSRDLGKASLETLALVLYKKGATRSEIDFVRGVTSSAALRTLLLRGLVERTEDEADRRRARYQPTPEALAHLGVSTIASLPRYEQFTAALAEHQAPQEVVETHAE